MNPWIVRVQPQAERDMVEIGERLQAAAGLSIAHKWMLAFERAIVSLRDNPYLGAESDLLGEGRRRLVLRPYLVVYRIALPDAVKILRVIDGRRDLPGLDFRGDT